MSNKWQLTAFALAGIVIQDMIQEYKLRKKNRHLQRTVEELTNHIFDLCEQMDYVAHIMQERGGQLDDFDLIVFNDWILSEE